MANCSSVFRFHGHAILPPLISDVERQALSKCRKDAMVLERKQHETRAIKYSKLLEQIRNVLEHIEQNKRNNATQGQGLSCAGPSSAVGLTSPERRPKTPSYSSTPLLLSTVSTVDPLYNKNPDDCEVVASGVSRQDSERHYSSNQNIRQGKGRSTARQLDLNSTWESSYFEYHQVFKNTSSTQEQLLQTVQTNTESAECEDNAAQDKGQVDLHARATEQHSQDDDQELSDKENSHLPPRSKYSSRFPENLVNKPESSIKPREDTPNDGKAVDAGPVGVSSTTETAALSSSEMESRKLAQAFIKLTACTKGFLTRALFKTAKVQAIIKTIEDTWSFSQDILKDGPKSMQERALQQRVSLQMKAAKEELSDIFHTLPVSERMEILSKSRELNRERQFGRTYKTNDDIKKNRLSTATMKAMQRRQQGHQSNIQEKPAKSEKIEKVELKQSIHPKPKATVQAAVRRRTDIRVLKPIQAHSSPRIPQKTTHKATTPRYLKPKSKVQLSKFQGKSENVNTEVQAGQRQAVGKSVTAAILERKQRAHTVPRTNNAAPRTSKTPSTRPLFVQRRIAVVSDSNQS